MTDTNPLWERIEHALWGVTQVYDARDGRGTEVGVHAPVYEVVAAVLPLIAAEVQAAKAEALRNLPPHLSLQIHQCKAREGGGSYCALEKGHSGDHRILGVPDEWVLGAADRYIEQIETGDQA